MKKSKRRRFHKTSWGTIFAQKVAIPLLYVVIRLLSRTWRVELVGLENLKRPFILTVFHGDLLAGSTELPRVLPIDVVISRSNDGRLMAQFTRYFGAGVIVGSSSRGQIAALRGMQRAIRQGRSFVVGVDGPRGPAGVVKSGVVLIASQTQAPVLPAAIVSDKSWQFNSWDKAFLPKPFSRVRFICGSPIYVQADASKETILAKRDELQETLRKMHGWPTEEVRSVSSL